MDVRTARATSFLAQAVASVLLGLLLVPIGAVAQVVAPTATADGAVRIATGRTVAIRYTLTLDDGTTVQTNADGPPLSYVAGQGQVIPGLEAALEGKGATDRIRVKIRPEDAYGPVDAGLMQEVPLDKIPEDARRVGTLLSAQGFDGPIRVAEVRADAVVLDFNHPLAGKALTFDVLVLSVN